MSEGQEGGLFSLIADVKYLIAVVLESFDLYKQLLFNPNTVHLSPKSF